MIVGIDVSKASFDVAWQTGEDVQHTQYAYTDEAIAKLLSQMPPDAHYVMEATGIYHTRLALTLYEAKRQVSVLNPLVIKRFAQMKLSRAKSDKADAELIRQYGEQHALAPWAPTPAAVRELHQAHGWLDDLIRERTRLLNRQEAHRHQAQASAFVDQQMKRQRNHLDTQIRECEAHLEGIVKKSFAELYAHLSSIPSFGAKTVIEMIVITHGFKRFDDVKKLSAYIGVSPTTYQSGTTVNGKGAIAKLGQGRMRQLLYLCSWTARRCNPACRDLYERMKAQGKPAKVINIAIAHKLVRQAFAVGTKNVPFAEQIA